MYITLIEGAAAMILLLGDVHVPYVHKVLSFSFANKRHILG